MMKAPKILVVDDEPAIRETLAEMLNAEGRDVVTAGTGEEALSILEDESFDLMLLDLIMPGLDGLQVMQKAHRLAPNMVIIMLTAHGTLPSAIQAMRHGAHDYILKPASATKIMASVEEGLQRRQETLRKYELVRKMEEALKELAVSEVGVLDDDMELEKQPTRFLQGREIVVDMQRQVVLARDQPVYLTPTELRILTTLMKYPDEVISARELVQEVQGYDCDELEARSIVRVHIRRLRKKLEEDPDDPRCLINVRGVGYMFSSRG